MVKIEKSWFNVLEAEFSKPYFLELIDKVHSEYALSKCFPPGNLIFNAYNLCPFDSVKVVIIGQDPYHNDGEAMGLSFSVPEGIALPPSLINIYKELSNDLSIPISKSGDLTSWANQGVLLLNSSLTVRAHCPNSHKNLGWNAFTDATISAISSNKKHVVFMLWGAFARSKKCLIDTTEHLVLEAAHPSPLSANRGGWFGNHHFSICNKYLTYYGFKPIFW